MSKTLSVVIPAYNGEKYIATALSSLVDGKNFIKEVIVALDHCTDNTETIAMQFAETIPVQVVHVAEGLPNGPGNARQAGLDVATGDWIGFLDVDDVFTTNTVQTIVKTLDELEAAEAKKGISIPMIIGNFTERNGKTGTTGFVHKNDSTWVHGKWYQRQFLIDHDIRFAPDLYTHEDVYFNNQVINHIIGCGFSYCTLDENLYFWNQNDHSMTSSPRYTEENFDDYSRSVMTAGLELCKIYPKKKDDYFKILLNNYCLMYLYYMNFLYYHPDDINPEIAGIMTNYFSKICEEYKVTPDEIWGYYVKMVDQYPKWKESVARSYHSFYEKWTLKDFLFDKVRVDA